MLISKRHQTIQSFGPSIVAQGALDHHLPCSIPGKYCLEKRSKGLGWHYEQGQQKRDQGYPGIYILRTS